MTEPVDGTGAAETSWRLANIALCVLALALVATSVLFFTLGAKASSEDPRAAELSRQYRAVTAAAKAETLAFLAVDYKNMDPLIAKVLEGATGTFKKQYEQTKVTLKASAQQAQAKSTGKVLSVGISDIDDTDAVVFVAANSTVSNKATRGKTQPRYYRLKLNMVRRDGTWLTSNLQFVG